MKKLFLPILIFGCIALHAQQVQTQQTLSRTTTPPATTATTTTVTTSAQSSASQAPTTQSQVSLFLVPVTRRDSTSVSSVSSVVSIDSTSTDNNAATRHQSAPPVNVSSPAKKKATNASGQPR